MADKEMKYGVEDFAGEAGVEPATARVMLRKANIKKVGTSYGWESMKDVKACVEKCRAGKGKKKAAPEKKAAPKKKAKKAVVRKAKAAAEPAGAEA